MEPNDAQLIGSTLGSYRLIEHLGSGGMAAVYRAQHLETNDEYALKVLRCGADASLDRFGREAVALSRLRHPNVVAIVDFGVTPDQIPFLVMEKVRGPTLAHLIEREAPMSLARAARYARDIACALDEAHALGFVHRDVKPANIMIHREDGQETVKLLDFGLVGLTQGAITNQITLAGMVIGTPRYMSPEQCSGEQVSFPADIYSLGLVLYEMITGAPPFVAQKAMSVMIMQVNDPPRPLPPCGGLEDLVMRLLQKKPENRPATVELVVSELDRLVDTLPNAAAMVAPHPSWEDDGGEDDTRPIPRLSAHSIDDTILRPSDREVRPMTDIPTDAITGPMAEVPPARAMSSVWFIAGIAIGAAMLIALLALMLLR